MVPPPAVPGTRPEQRWFWLDGERSVVGVLAEDDVSLTFDATRGEVHRHQGREAILVGDDVFEVLEAEISQDAGDPDVHWVGYLGYAARTDLPAAPWGVGPDAVWMRCRRPVVVERGPLVVPTGSTPGPVEAATPDWYLAAFAEVQEQLHAGNSYEVNLTYRDEGGRRTDPLETYLRLRAANPAPYAGMLVHHDTCLLSSSPERYAAIDRHRTLETRPIKGTTPRGRTPAEDELMRARLATDPKFRAENLMIVDLLRNDLSMVCEAGSVEVPQLMAVESYASVHQLVSTVRGRLRDGVSTVAALRALFPAGSMTGAPKRRTMEIIDAVETTPRGPYAGAFGWISADGRADLGVVIRSLWSAGPSWWLGTGGGITVRSEAQEEWAETLWKAERLRSVLG